MTAQKVAVMAVVFLAVAGFILLGFSHSPAKIWKSAEKEDAFARQFLQAVFTSDYVQAEGMLAVNNEEWNKGLRDLNGLFEGEKPKRIDGVGITAGKSVSEGVIRRRAHISYEIELQDRWLVGTILVDMPADGMKIASALFKPHKESLTATNAFSLTRKPLKQIVILLFFTAVPIFCIVTLVICIRTPLGKKWRWIIFIALCFSQFSLDWTSGRIGFNLLSINLLGFGFSKASGYAPWLFFSGLPVGAIIFHALRHRLSIGKTNSEAQEVVSQGPAPTPTSNQ